MGTRDGTDVREDEVRATQEEHGVRLPMAGADASDAEGPGVVGGEGPVSPSGEPVGHPIKADVSSLRLVATLAVAGAIAGFVIVLVFQWAQPRIEAHQARVLSEAVVEVLGGADRYETAFLVDGTFTTAPPPAADTSALDRVYVGYGEGGRPVGVALAAQGTGFQDVIRLIFGYDPGDDEVLGMKVLDNKETPGLGDKIVKDSVFVGEFAGVSTPLQGVKSGRATGAENEVDMITGATISSEAVISIINRRLGELQDPLGAWWARGGPATAAAVPDATASPAGGAR